jgi:glycosyltransferase involved in cell wall biosynthesis
MDEPSRLRVAMDPLTLSREVQPYVALLADALSASGIAVEGYRTLDVTRNPPAVIHFHWPEHVLALSPLRKRIRALVVLSAISVARLRGTALVLTAHNASPHDLTSSRFDRWFLTSFDRLVDGVLILSRAGWEEIVTARPKLSGSAVTHTHHGDFRQAYPPPPSAAQARKSLGLDPDRTLVVFVGQVRAYKGVPELLDAANDVDVDVLVAGSCTDSELRNLLEQRARSDGRIHLRLEHLSGEDLTNVVAAASLVALPYRRVLNSGSALLALSLERPVLVPPTPSFRELRDEVGPRWVVLCRDQRISSADLESALAQLPQGAPNLEKYQWSHVAAETENGYIRAIATKLGASISE